VLKPNPQCDGTRRGGLWEVISHEGGALVGEISPLIKETPKSLLILPPHGDTAKRQPLVN